MFEAVQNLFDILGLSMECPPTMQLLLPWLLKVFVGIAILAAILRMFESMSLYFMSGGKRYR